MVSILRMEGLDILGIVHEKEYDPMRYASFLEPAGFENVNVSLIPLYTSCKNSLNE